MKKGYLILAQNTNDHDYLRLAYGLALSIKNTQSSVNSVSIITDSKNVPLKYHKVFDRIIDIPWHDAASKSSWKIENKWKYYFATPYEETVILDADMLFPADISYWWDILSSQDIWIADSPRTFRGDVITSTKYRVVFETNQLPNVYTAFMYFKKTKPAAELFSLAEIIFNNWQRFYYQYLDENRPKHLSGDVAFALAIKLLGMENICFGHSSHIPSFVHMKGHLQGIDEKFITENWIDNLPTYFMDDGSFYIGNYRQSLPFHYHIKEWLTDDILKTMENQFVRTKS